MKFFLTVLIMTVVFATMGTAHAATVLITGSNRGLGLEFTRHYAARGWDVIATCRTPNSADDLKALQAQHAKVTIEQLDVVNQNEIDALAAKYKDQPIDLLINNAGVLGDLGGQTLGSFDYRNFQHVMRVNVYGVLAVSEAFRENVAMSDQKKIIGITSGAGIISLGSGGGQLHFYRMSKVALNMALKGLASDLRDRGVLVGIIAPGTADTDMRRAIVGDQAALDQDPADSVSGMMKVISNLTLANSAQPYNYDGQVLPW